MNSPVPTKPWRDIIRSVTEEDRAHVRKAQLILGLPLTGEMDEGTIAHLRGVQRIFNLRVTGILDEYTMQYVSELRWVEDAV